MKTRVAWVVLLAITCSLPVAWAGQKHMKHQTIARLDGHVHVLLPCNWLPGEPMTITGLYGDGREAKPMPNTRLEYSKEPLKPGTNRYVEVIIGEEDRVGLNEAVLEFEDTGKRCPDDVGQSNFTQ